MARSQVSTWDKIHIEGSKKIENSICGSGPSTMFAWQAEIVVSALDSSSFVVRAESVTGAIEEAYHANNATCEDIAQDFLEAIQSLDALTDPEDENQIADRLISIHVKVQPGIPGSGRWVERYVEWGKEEKVEGPKAVAPATLGYARNASENIIHGFLSEKSTKEAIQWASAPRLRHKFFEQIFADNSVVASWYSDVLVNPEQILDHVAKRVGRHRNTQCWWSAGRDASSGKIVVEIHSKEPGFAVVEVGKGDTLLEVALFLELRLNGQGLTPQV